MEEIWKDCTLNPAYKISNYGRFKSLSGAINYRKPHDTGYIRVYIKSIGIRPLHVLVALAFIPNLEPTQKTMVNHIDGTRTNNHVTNLEWVTPTENNLKRKNTAKIVNKYKDINFEGEEWKYIIFDGIKLRASSFGRIETSHGYKTFGSVSSDGYLNININSSLRRVHRIICTAFHGYPKNNKYVVNHKDFNRKNNTPNNLEWVTQKDNVNHAKITKAPCISHNRRRVCQYTLDKITLLATYSSISEASLKTGANRSAIVQLCRGYKSNKLSTVGGFYWKYE